MSDSADYHRDDEFWSQGRENGPEGMLYTSVLSLVLKATGYTVTGHEAKIEPIVADVPTSWHISPEPIAPGRCIGMRVVGEVFTQEGVTGQVEGLFKLFQPGEEQFMAWKIEGTPALSLRVNRNDAENVTLMSLFNRIPDVMAAEPGIVPITMMGPLRHSALA